MIYKYLDIHVYMHVQIHMYILSDYSYIHIRRQKLLTLMSLRMGYVSMYMSVCFCIFVYMSVYMTYVCLCVCIYDRWSMYAFTYGYVLTYIQMNICINTGDL
jgi:hypothetical protein